MARRAESVSSFHSSFGRQSSYDENIAEIQNLVNVHERGGRLDNSAYQHVGITKSHWKKASEVVHCANLSCNKKFALFDRKRNCRICGDVFCRPCTEFERRLSPTAVPDPLGKLYPVCKACHGTEEQTVGGFRNNTDYFRSVRYRIASTLNEVKHKAQHNIRADSAHRYNRRVDYTIECLRLTVGFQNNSNVLKQTFSEITGKVPEWQKSSHWNKYNKAHECSVCSKHFSVLSRKIHCRVCSKLCCTSCVKEDLLLYINEDGDSKWGLNGVVAFSTKPSKYCLLFACTECGPELEKRLLEAMKREEETEDMVEEEQQQSITFFEELIPLESKLWKMQCDISNWLPPFIKDIDSFSVSCSSSKLVGLHSLAKANIDLSDAFSKLSIASQKLRTLRPTTKGEAQVLNNCVKGTLLFYSENMYLFRQALKSLSDFAPTNVLESLQAIVCETTLRNVLTVCKSICYNLLLLEKECSIDKAAVLLLTDLVTSLDDDFKIALKRSKGEDYEQVIKDIDELVQLELLSSPRIRKPRSKSKKAVYKQCIRPLCSCRRELEAKTPKKEFEDSKGMLEILLEAKTSPFK